MEFIRNPSTPTTLEIIALLFLTYFLLYRPAKLIVKWFLNNCCCSASRSKAILSPKVDDYAVITGASDGIGLEYAKQLAEKGYNLLLISRTEEKLKRVATEIKKQYPQAKKIEILAVDFTKTDIYPQIQLKLESLDGTIQVLVNNVGIMYNLPEYFANYPDGYHLNLINANIVSMTVMSEIVLRLMCTKGRSKGVKGIIINVSSSLGNTKVPMMSTYCASKVYVNYLSRILSTEYGKNQILIQTVTPNQVDTNLNKDFRNSMLSVPVTTFVRYALGTVGSEQQTCAHPKHKFINSIFGTISGLLGEGTWMKVLLCLNLKLRADYDRKVSPLP